MELNSFQLKCIAVITMAIDHTGAVLFPQILLFRYVGRLAFPVFCFLLTEGFFHTRNVKKYMFRLGVFAIISEVPYDLAFRKSILEFTHQNVFFTLLIGVIMMYALERSSEWPVKVVVVILSMWFASWICSDYSFKGILLIAIYYFLRDNKMGKFGVGALWNFMWNSTIQMYGALASIPIALYNGEKGRSVKYFFYLFYPLHLSALYAVSVLLF